MNRKTKHALLAACVEKAGQRGRPVTFCADQYGYTIYWRLQIWETPTKGEDGSGTNRCPGIEPATYSNSPSNASRACRVVMAFGVELRSSRSPVTRKSQSEVSNPTRTGRSAASLRRFLEWRI